MALDIRTHINASVTTTAADLGVTRNAQRRSIYLQADPANTGVVHFRWQNSGDATAATTNNSNFVLRAGQSIGIDEDNVPAGTLSAISSTGTNTVRGWEG